MAEPYGGGGNTYMGQEKCGKRHGEKMREFWSEPAFHNILKEGWSTHDFFVSFIEVLGGIGEAGDSPFGQIVILF